MTPKEFKILCRSADAGEQAVAVLERVERQLASLAALKIKGAPPVWQEARRMELYEQRLRAQEVVATAISHKARLERIIRGAPDVQLMQILEMRCKRHFSWQQIAWRLGGGNTADAVRKRVTRYLQGVKLQ